PLLRDDATEARLHLLDSQLAWHRSDLERARSAVDASLEGRSTYDALAARAFQAWHRGDHAAAEVDYLAAAATLPHEEGQPAAWIELQRGLMDLDRDRLDEALEHYLAADRALPGWWLVHEHVAEIFVLSGRERAAEAIYRDVVRATGAPEFQDALADLVGPESAEGRSLREAARATWDERLAAHPEAAGGHAIDHFLAAGDDPRALALAEANVAARPSPLAYALLAEVHAAAARWTEAEDAVRWALETGFQTPALLDLSARLHRERGARDEARALEARADGLRGRPGR
ncbi:MAG: hypothetical protein AAF602_16895, partial [Myxococcota bacterium]